VRNSRDSKKQKLLPYLRACRRALAKQDGDSQTAGRDALIRRVPKGKVATVLQLREVLAKGNRVDIACPLCTGIFVRIAAEAAEEERRAGKKSVTPYWRVISSEGRLNPKFPGGVARQRSMLSSEGHKILRATGKKAPAVADFQSVLVRFQPPD
jgi:hypothetical protein